MSNIAVPIDSSNVKDIIPPDEEIIYSTFYRSQYNLFGGGNYWGGHLLMTIKGVYLNIPKEVTKKQIEEVFIPWYNVIDVKMKTLVIGGLEAVISLTLTILRDSNRETEDAYVARMVNFVNFVNNIRIPVRYNKAREIYNLFKENPKLKQKNYEKKYGEISSELFNKVKKNFKKGNEPLYNLK